MKKVFQTNDKRTVKRRLKKLKQRAKALEIEEWVKKTEICLSVAIGWKYTNPKNQ